MLSRARLPVFGGLLTDIAGATAAIELAQKLGGVVDHAGSDALCRMSQIVREAGGAPVSYGEARNRADVVVVVGKGPLERDPDLAGKLFPEEPGLPRPGDNPRSLVLLGAGKAKIPSRIPLTAIGAGTTDLPTLVSMLAALVREGCITARRGVPVDALESLAETLRGAAFAVFVYDPAELEVPVLQVMLDMVRSLSATTRASTLSLPVPGNGDGVNLCSSWTCGLPVRTSFAGPVPRNDPWLYAADRLIDSGEADALVWIDSLGGKGPKRPEGVPTVVLTASGTSGRAPEIAIDVACAGRDHDAALYVQPLSGIGWVKAATPDRGKPTVAAVLARLAELIDKREAA